MFTFDRRGHKRCIKSVSVLIAFVALSAVAGAGSAETSGILVELKHETTLSLRVTLRSAAEKTVRIPRSRLPWISGQSMVIVAAIADGRCLNRELPVDDPLFDEISGEPHTPASGDIDLERLFPDIRQVLKKSDVQLFWAYEAPQVLNIRHWSGGWILIPKLND